MDGMVSDITVICNEVLIDGKSVEIPSQQIADVISGYISEDDSIRAPFNDILYDMVNKYMDLSECELYTYTYVYIIKVGDFESDYSTYVSSIYFQTSISKLID